MNNKEFDQFLRSEVDSINYGGAEQSWEQFSAAKVDKQIKNEVEAIKYPEGEMAWEQFSAQHSVEDTPRRSRFVFGRLLIAAASVAILVGVMLHHSMNDGTVNIKQVASNPAELEGDDTTINIVSPIQNCGPIIK